MEEEFDISKEIAKKMTDASSKDHHIMVINERGSGMSFAAISYAENVAKHMAAQKYGNTERWKEFFDEKYDVIDSEKMKLMLKR
jgi:chemotaxis regulatin CheY-phosphate phosphatase CheZ